jgi:hypothetical protein
MYEAAMPPTAKSPAMPDSKYPSDAKEGRGEVLLGG